MKWETAKKEILKNKEVLNELNKNEIEYLVIEELIKARIEKKLTQKALAEMIGTKQSNISRFERGNFNTTLDFLYRITKALGKEIKLSIN